jgi:hypothetical protein
MPTALLSGLLFLAAQAAGAGTGAGAQAPMVLACNIPRVSATAGAPPERLFRIAPGSLQEWDVRQQKFGANFCLDFPCVRSPKALEGTVSSASVAYTIGIDSGTGAAYWRVKGASGFKPTEGTCRVVPAPTPRAP